MRLTRNFTLEELTASDMAARRAIDNAPPPPMIATLRRVAEALQATRDYLSAESGRDCPIVVSSGYRSRALNEAIGGSAKSHHMLGAAADWTCPAFGSPIAIAAALVPVRARLGWSQIILEYGRWVHTSIARVEEINVVLTIDHRGTTVGIHDSASVA